MARTPGSFNALSHSPAVLQAASDLAMPDRAPTRRELAHHLMLSTREIAATVDNLTRTGRLLPVRLRTVAYRTRPVAEYAPAVAAVEQHAPESRHGHGWVDLGRCVSGWAR